MQTFTSALIVPICAVVLLLVTSDASAQQYRRSHGMTPKPMTVSTLKWRTVRDSHARAGIPTRDTRLAPGRRPVVQASAQERRLALTGQFDPFDSGVRQAQAEEIVDPFETAEELPAPSPRLVGPNSQAEELPAKLPTPVMADTSRTTHSPAAPSRDEAQPYYAPSSQGRFTQDFRRQPPRRTEPARLKGCDDLESQPVCNIDAGLARDSSQSYPDECDLPGGYGDARCFAETLYTWKASALCHKPLYFEQEQLERYGHEAGPVAGPIIAGAHFFLQLPILPYKMGMRMPNECVYALGHYRPGSCSPWYVATPGYTLRAHILQTAAVAGAVAIVP